MNVYMYICSNSYYIHFRMYICLLLLSVTLFTCHFVLPYEVSKVLRVFLPVPVVLSVCLC